MGSDLKGTGMGIVSFSSAAFTLLLFPLVGDLRYRHAVSLWKPDTTPVIAPEWLGICTCL